MFSTQLATHLKENRRVVFEHIKTTIIGLLFLVVAFLFEWETWVMFTLIAIGILLLFAKDQIPAVIKGLIDKYLKK